MSTIFSFDDWSFVNLLCRNVIPMLCPCFNCFVFCCWVLRVLYIHWIYAWVPYRIHDCKCLLCPVSRLFTYLMVLFAAQKFKLWWSSMYLHLVLLLVLWCPTYENTGCNNLLLFDSKRFMILAHTFGSMIHFEWFFCVCVSYGSNFILLYVDVQLSQQHLLKCSIEFSWHLCQKSIEHKFVDPFLDSLLCSTNLYGFLTPKP